MADHIDHVAKLVGIDHVGIGSDADLHGYDDMKPDEYALLKGAYKDSYAFRDKIDIDGFDHPLKTFDLVEDLIRRNYSNDNIRAVLGDRKSVVSGKSVSVRVDLGGRRVIKKKIHTKQRVL